MHAKPDVDQSPLKYIFSLEGVWRGTAVGNVRKNNLSC